MTETPGPIDGAAIERLREWGGDDLVGQMVGLFLKNAPERMAQIRDGLTGAEAETVERGAHSLKSSAGNLGAETLRDLAAQVEEAAEEEDLVRLAELVPRLESEYERSYAALEAIAEDGASADS